LETQLNYLGKRELYAPKQIQKHSSLKKVDQPAKLSVSAAHAKYVASVWNMHLAMMSALVSGAVSPSVNAVV
jgi:hypothetical protein